MDMPVTLDEAERYFDRGAISQAAGDGAGSDQRAAAQADAQSARLRAVRDLALSAGVKVGLAWQLKNINQVILDGAHDLDSIYNFGPLMVQQRVVPPVITEARDLYNQSGEQAVRLSGALYRIERQARFSAVAPSWREYLNLPVPKPGDALQGVLAPRTDEERAIWRASVRSGWEQGVESANWMFTSALDRLNRDFAGMARYHRFAVEGKVSLPAVASETMPVTKYGDVMAVDETLLRLTTLPQFDATVTRWQGRVTDAATTDSSGASPLGASR